MKRIISEELFQIIKEIRIDKLHKETTIGAIMLFNPDKIYHLRDLFVVRSYDDFTFIEVICNNKNTKAEKDKNVIIMLNTEEDINSFKEYFKRYMFLDGFSEYDFSFITCQYDDDGNEIRRPVDFEEFFMHVHYRAKQLNRKG